MSDTILVRAGDEDAIRMFQRFLDTLFGYVRMEKSRAPPARPKDWGEALDGLFDENV